MHLGYRRTQGKYLVEHTVQIILYYYYYGKCMVSTVTIVGHSKEGPIGIKMILICFLFRYINLVSDWVGFIDLVSSIGSSKVNPLSNTIPKLIIKNK